MKYAILLVMLLWVPIELICNKVFHKKTTVANGLVNSFIKHSHK